MSDENQYPMMLYKDGDTAGANVIVNDADEEKIAKGDGFVRFKTPAALKAEREAAAAAEAKAEAAKKEAEEKAAAAAAAEAAKNGNA